MVGNFKSTFSKPGLGNNTTKSNNSIYHGPVSALLPLIFKCGIPVMRIRCVWFRIEWAVVESLTTATHTLKRLSLHLHWLNLDKVKFDHVHIMVYMYTALLL